MSECCQLLLCSPLYYSTSIRGNTCKHKHLKIFLNTFHCCNTLQIIKGYRAYDRSPTWNLLADYVEICVTSAHVGCHRVKHLLYAQTQTNIHCLGRNSGNRNCNKLSNLCLLTNLHPWYNCSNLNFMIYLGSGYQEGVSKLGFGRCCNPRGFKLGSHHRRCRNLLGQEVNLLSWFTELTINRTKMLRRAIKTKKVKIFLTFS